MKTILLALCLLTLGFVQSPAGDVGKGDTKGADVGLSITLHNKKDSYKLDLAGKTVKEWEELLKIGKKLGSPLPKPPAVDMELHIKNTTGKAIGFWSTGDPVQVKFEFKGPAARTIQAPLAFTADFKLPKTMTLEPGKTFVIPIKNLQTGFRGIGTWHYWLTPGEYTITPGFKTGISPAPPGTKEVEGAGVVTLVGKSIAVQVVE